MAMCADVCRAAGLCAVWPVSHGAAIAVLGIPQSAALPQVCIELRDHSLVSSILLYGLARSAV